ncbi:MAG: synaptic vesicle VAT-1 family membrane protein [Bradymonadia bacterium]
MRSIWIPKKGAPEVLELREGPDPTPGPGEVRIKVAATGVNFADIMARMGLYPDAPPMPCVVGYEVSGTVDALGEGVSDVEVGQKVMALTRFGGYADMVVVPARRVSTVPDNLPLIHGAAIPVTYLTAWLMLVHLGGVRAGDRVLVHSAGGGVGLAATQICKHFGAEIFGTASAGKHDRLREAGVHHCIDYRTQDFEQVIKEITDGAGVQIAIDAVGGRSFTQSYNSLAPMGRLFMFGVSSFTPGKRRSLVAALKGLLSLKRYGPIKLMNDNKGVFGVNLGDLWDHDVALKKMLDDILALVAEGVLSPVVDATFPMEEAAKAHTYIQERRNFGKVLLTT